ncbi:MAG TPA: hypothetical protein VGF49_22565 [Candidatus Solibacter sp.]
MLAFVCAAGTEPRWRELNKAAREAVQAKDYAKLRATLIEIRPLLPGNPRVAYNLAASEAKLGHREAALAALRKWAGMGLVYDVAADEDFVSVRDAPEFRAIVERVAESRKAVTGGKTAFAIAEPDFLPEDIAYDAKTRRFFLSGVRQGKIVTGDGKPFAQAEWSVLALRADAKRRTLWAATGWVPRCAICKATDKDKTALLAFDLDTGTLKQRVESPVPGLLGDMTLGRGGDIYVSEGIHGAVLWLKAGGKLLERLDAEGEFPSPQTPALSADERTLYVPDYVRGIAAIRVKDRKVEWLAPADDIALSGIDGLYVYGGGFLAVQNGTTPARVVRFSGDLKKMQVLEANTPGLGEPTHGVIVGDEFYFIANSGWGEYDGEGKKKAGSGAVESSVRKIRLAR